ncbi:hypothetical protein NDU88_005184 [Pleurodeles waltl]|uniref:Uncharacterized protein n=1 Tax=Pleurodeles waltl TaxID=8319 RepID=A0AAV7SL38_PLEWA|nr:hypothetical protein NDU88_005184 [Pleurodeles waltl]
MRRPLRGCPRGSLPWSGFTLVAGPALEVAVWARGPPRGGGMWVEVNGGRKIQSISLGRQINMLTLKVMGLKRYMARYRVHSFLRRHKVQMACLQETHMAEEESPKLAKKWLGQMFSSSFSSYARVAIWVAPGVSFTHVYSEADVEGRYILLQGMIDGVLLTIINT